jgi:predicted Ser/Thr protein kinase
MQRMKPDLALELALRRNAAARVCSLEAAHNPEVAGSNPAPATSKGPGNRAFCLQRPGIGSHTCSCFSAARSRAALCRLSRLDGRYFCKRRNDMRRPDSSLATTERLEPNRSGCNTRHEVGEVPTGTILAGYRVGSLIGEGAVGAVYLAQDTRTGSQIALKLLTPELARDERFRRRFLRESKLAARLDHPHVVPTLAAGEEDGVLYLAMAYISGSDLREVLRREGRLDPQRALRLVGQVAEALDAAHRLGLVPRDVKPGNVLVAVEPDGEDAYVSDFGPGPARFLGQQPHG